MGGIENAVKKGSRLTRVRRRAAGTRGSDGRFTPAAELAARVKLYIQPVSRSLNRELPGDSTEGDIKIWASKTYLAAAYDETDVGQTPLGWSGLQVAPPENTNGPPGDRIEWYGREYEVVDEKIWDDGGLVSDSRFRRYIADERGPIP